VSRAIETEIREGRGIMNPDHKIEHVWIDVRHLPDHVHDVQIPEVASFFRKFVNIDSKKELCPIRPSNHYHMGGIPTDEFGRVEKGPGEVIPGLFAVGECGAASLHGFNRLGTNSLLELITMGKFAGEKAVELLGEKQEEMPAGAGEKTFAQFSGFLATTGKASLGEIRQTMQAVMTEKVGVFREEKGITEAISKLGELQKKTGEIAISGKSLTMNQELIQRWELKNLLAVSMVIAQGALYRKDSRGGHFREDYPERHGEFNDHTLTYMTEFGKVRFGKRPVDMSLFEAKGAHYEKFGMIERKY